MVHFQKFGQVRANAFHDCPPFFHKSFRKHPCMGNPKEIRHCTERLAIAAGHVPFDHIIVPYVAQLLQALLFLSVTMTGRSTSKNLTLGKSL